MRDTHCINRISVIARTLFLVLFLSLFQVDSPVWAQATGEVKTAENDKVTKKQVAENKAGDNSAQKKKVKAGGVKELSGISIIGNKEAPKSLYIVPWKNSEVGIRSSLTSGLLDGSMRPIDKEVFIRELDFYELSHSK